MYRYIQLVLVCIGGINMDVQFITTTSDQLDDIKIINGQVIALSDTDAYFYDMGDVRRTVAGAKEVDELPELGQKGFLYIVRDYWGARCYTWDSDTKTYVHVFNNSFVPIKLADYKKLSYEVKHSNVVFFVVDVPTGISLLNDDISDATHTYSSRTIDNKLSFKADLVNGIIPASQLPAYVDDVEEYASKSAFPTEGEASKIYVDLSANLIYRWSGSTYVEISKSLALGETSSTAYAGNKGKQTTDTLSALIQSKGVPDGIVPLDSGGHISVDFIPSELGNKYFNAISVTGEESAISITDKKITGSDGATISIGKVECKDMTVSNSAKIKTLEAESLKITGADTTKSLTVASTGDVVTTGGIATQGNLSVSGTLNAGGNISTGGDITATGNITGAKVYNAVWSADYAEGFVPYDDGEYPVGSIVELADGGTVQ